MNQIVLIGNLVRDPEIRNTQSGAQVCSFTIAVQRRIANKQTGERESDFINCVAWRNTAEFVSKYFTKGSKIGVIGSLQTRTYEANDGSKRHVTEVAVENAEFVERRQGGNDHPSAQQKNVFTEVDVQDDLPF